MILECEINRDCSLGSEICYRGQCRGIIEIWFIIYKYSDLFGIDFLKYLEMLFVNKVGSWSKKRSNVVAYKVTWGKRQKLRCAQDIA